MSDLGLTFVWLAVQVALVLGPALALQGWVARRRPAAGAWVASVSLGAVIVLTAAVFVPTVRTAAITAPTGPQSDSPIRRTRTHRAAPQAAVAPRGGVALDFEALARVWGRLGHRAAAPAARFRPWGGALAAVTIAGAGLGALQMALGLWAIRICRRRGRTVDDPALSGMLGALQASMGCTRTIDLREVDDLATPATAGWIRPVILLPPAWRAWNDSTRRAVLAHELAHIVRGDFATGLLARLAVTLNAWHPLVRWMAARLHVQQELAADALGAEHAGGRGCYLRALSQLALEHNGPAPRWPARAFLPRRGLLIRRIRMLREDRLNRTDSPLWRVLPAAALAVLTSAVGLLHGPALGDEKAPAPTVTTRSPAPAPLYLRDGKDGVLVVRPAAALRHSGMDRLGALAATEFKDALGVDFADAAKALKIDPKRPGFLHLEWRDIEWITASIGFGPTRGKDKTHTIMLNNPVIRTVAPFDWLAFFRQWHFEVAEVRTEKGVYHTLKGPLAVLFGPNPHCAVYQPDDRTIVLDDEANIRKLVGVPPATPDYLRGADWEVASQGLLAVALKNQGDSFTKDYDLGRPDDAQVITLFKGVDRWIVSVADSDALALTATAVCRNPDASAALVRAATSLRALARAEVAQPVAQTDGDEADREQRLAKALLDHITILQGDRPSAPMVSIRVDGCGQLAEWAGLYAGLAREADARGAGREDANRNITR